jgi:hypothetical protein
MLLSENTDTSNEELTMELGGRFDRNLARTTPELPCGRVTLPQMHRMLVPSLLVLAL